MDIRKIRICGGIFVFALTMINKTAGYGRPIADRLQGASKPVSENCLWMQQASISPDGRWIAFEYKGNIYKVSSKGGMAVALTNGRGYTGYPVWSHDGKNIAYATDRNGSFDVYVMPSKGGTSRRLTYASRRDIPIQFSADDSHVYFLTDRHDVYTSARFPVDIDFKKIFSVPVTGGKNIMVNSAGADFASFNHEDNKILFEDFKGHENPWRMHQRGPVTKDIWLYDVVKKSYWQLTDFTGEDREPIWGAGNIFYYLSERNGSQNLYRSTITEPSKVTQLTHFSENPVRNLSRSADGTLAFTQNGELYTLLEGKLPKKLSITIIADSTPDEIQKIKISGDITEMAISLDGRQIAYVYRGDIFVMSATDTLTKRITYTPYQERMVQFSPDGRTLLYSVENNGSWNIYQATIANKKESFFFSATKIDFKAVIATPKDEFQGIYSPDGKSIAYLEDRNTLRVYDTYSKKTVTVLPGGLNYSYTDGDQSFSWSPDSKYLLVVSAEGVSNRNDIILVSADGKGDRVNLTQSGFSNSNPNWGMNGRLLYYLSDKQGLMNLSGGMQNDVYAMFFTQKDFDDYESGQHPEIEGEKNAIGESTNFKNNGYPRDTIEAPLIKQEFLENHSSRVRQLTENSAFLSAAVLSPDGEKLYLLAQLAGGFDIWVVSPQRHDTKLLAKTNIPGGDLLLSKDGKTLYLFAGGRISKINTDNGNVSEIPIRATTTVDPPAERAYILEHTYHLLCKKFYDPALKGINWDGYYRDYQRFLPHINNNYDFTMLLSEFEGELNASHTGANYYAATTNGDRTAALGLLYDLTDPGDGLKVEEVIAGGPFDSQKSKLKKGCVIDTIDGGAITADKDWASFLNHKYDRNITIAFHTPSGQRYSENIKPLYPGTETYDLLYKRWVKKMEHLTDSLSGGQIGYIHIRSMDEQSLRETIDKTLGVYGQKKAIIIDTRYNPGGNIRAQLASFLQPENGFDIRPQGHLLADQGSVRHLNKPTCVLIGEDNYSDAFNFPYLYQVNGTGKLVGMPVAGSAVGVWFETQVDPSISIGFPQVGLSLRGGDNKLLENQQLDPDIKVKNDYDEILKGNDQQLAAAVTELLKSGRK